LNLIKEYGIHLSKERENFETLKTYMFELLNQNKTI
jgi:hypothetical protein